MGLIEDACADFEALFIADEFGQTCTYAPADGTTPFAAIVIIGRLQPMLFEHDRSVDQVELRILHSTLVAAGVTEPVPRRGNQAGDVLTIDDANGVARQWTVTGVPEYRLGIWVLTIERQAYIIP